MFKLIILVEILFVVSIKAQFSTSQAKIDVNELKCLVCQVSINELEKLVKNIDPTKTVDVGGYQLDVDGNYKKKTVSQAKSEIHLSEVIEELCNKMDDYVRATWKSNGTLTLLKLMTDDGKMNSDMSEVDIIQDDDLNKSVKYNCEGIVEEYEDNIISHFKKGTTDIEREVCVLESKLCPTTSNKNKSEL